MRLDAFLLADAASAPPDGKLYVHGAGLTRINAPILPLTLQLGVVIRLAMTEEELRGPHSFGLSFTDPEGALMHPLLQMKSEGLREIDLVEGEELFAQVAVNVGGLTFAREGQYKVEFVADDRTLRTMTLPVVLAQTK